METVSMPDGAIVQRYRVIGTDTVVYHACRPLAYCPARGASHSSWFSHGGQFYGRVGTERLPAELDALPAMSAERSRAVLEWLSARYADGYALIRAAYPAVVGQEDMGAIVAVEPR